MKIVAIANQKGGVGKTVTAQALLHAAAARGKRALGIDLDSQGNMSQQLTGRSQDDWFPTTIADVMHPGKDGMSPGEETPITAAIVSTRREGIDLVPSGLDAYVALELHLAGTTAREFILNTVMEQLPEQDYDLVVIDCPAALGLTLTNVLAVVDSVVIVTEPSSAGFLGVDRILRTMETANKYIGRILGRQVSVGGLVINQHRTGVAVEQRFIDQITHYAQAAEIPMFGRPLPLLAFIKQASSAGYGFDELRDVRAVEIARHFDTMLDSLIGKD